MKDLRWLWLVPATLCLMAGLWYVVLALGWALDYFMADTGPTRNEYFIGVFFSLVRALPFWVLASCFVFPVRRLLPRKIFWGINASTILLCLLFFLAELIPLLAVAFFDRR